MSKHNSNRHLTELSQTFRQLAGTLSIDPDDLEFDEVKRLFEKAIKEHDYFYDYSDDLRVYDRGQAELNIILEHTNRDKDLYEIWKAFCKEEDKK